MTENSPWFWNDAHVSKHWAGTAFRDYSRRTGLDVCLPSFLSNQELIRPQNLMRKQTKSRKVHESNMIILPIPLYQGSKGLQEEQSGCHHLNLSHWNKSNSGEKKAQKSCTRELWFSYKKDTRMGTTWFPVCIPLGLTKHFKENIIISWLKEHFAKPFSSECKLIQLNQHIESYDSLGFTWSNLPFPPGKSTLTSSE